MQIRPTGKRNVYEAAGGDAPFHAIVDRFYEGVDQDPILNPMYPEADHTEAKRKLALFLIQYFGGPATYSEERGHPRLRMRHMPFRVDAAARNAWMTHMRTAIEAAPIDDDTRKAMIDYFEYAATFMINSRER